MEYREDLDIRPLPVGANDAPAAVNSLKADLDAATGQVDDAAANIADSIITHVANDPPTEVDRLWGLYSRAYTREELERLASNSFEAAGLRD